MRLTLRTLLAWLDDVLPVEEKAELDGRVAASPVTPQLIERIRHVVEQPVLSAPPPTGRGLGGDPNTVAEFLDNSLASEQLKAFERICLESDVHLAEVAACHGILAAAARDPQVWLPLDEAGRHHLLGAMKHRSALLAAAAQRREALATARMMQEANGIEANGRGADERPESAQPAAAAASSPVGAGGRRSSTMAWVSAIAAVTLLAALAGVLGRTLGCGADRGRQVATRNAPAPAVGPASPESGPPPEPPPELPPQQPVRQEQVQPPPVAALVVNAAAAEMAAANEPAPGQPAVAVPEPPPQAAKPQPAVAVTEPPADEGREGSVPEPAAAAAGPPASLAEAPRVPEGDALAIAAPQAAVAAGVPALGRPAGQSPATGSVAAPPPAEVPALPGPAPFGVVGDGQLLLRRVVEDGQQSWMRFPAGSPLSAREELLVPPGFHPSVTVGGVNVALQPCTRATLLTDPDGTPRLEVVFGRVVARAGRSDARLGVTAGGMAGTIMAGLAEPVAVQVDLLRPPGADPASEPARTRAAIVATRGGIQWRQAVDGVAALEGMAAEGMLESHSAIEWNGVDPGRVVVRPSQPPEWADGPPRIEKLERGACEALVAKVVATAPLGKALRELADDRRVENRMIAAETLALLGEFDDLVELLCEAAPEKRLKSQQWSALEAATVPLALARGANAAAKLGRAFDDHGPTGKAGLLQAMSRGFSDEQLAEGADARLVEALDDADLVVRRYAIKCLVDITQPAASDRIRYRPDALPDPRRDGVTWWQGQLKKGLIRRPSSPPAAGAATRPASG